MIELRNAFVGAFKEGLSVFFSPFAGFWQSIRQLRARSAQSGATTVEKAVGPAAPRS
jgi:hypothetical protein